jgi:CRISPR-associated protein Cmr2
MADHKKLNSILDIFTQAVKRGLVEDYGGYLIYAGGDDVLALFPANWVLATAEALAKKYRELFETWPHHGHKDENDEDFPFTASAGIAFAHHLYPLDGVLAAARQAEKRAKNQHGRNALSVTVVRRSGETSEMGGKWAGESWLGKPAPNTVEMVAGLIKLLEADQISTRFPSSVLRDADVVTMINDKSARKSILQQLLKRHRTEKLPDDELKSLVKDWVAWANAHDRWTTVRIAKRCQENDEEDKPTSTQGFAELARWFGLARWLATGGQE